MSIIINHLGTAESRPGIICVGRCPVNFYWAVFHYKATNYVFVCFSQRVFGQVQDGGPEKLATSPHQHHHEPKSRGSKMATVHYHPQSAIFWTW